MSIGMLMESAQAQQRLAQDQLTHLHAHTQDLDVIVRDEIRRTLVEELKALQAAIDSAALNLSRLKRVTVGRATLLAAALGLISGAAAPSVAFFWLPSAQEIASLEKQRQTLSVNVESLRRAGGGVELRQCGQPARLCARVDAHAPKYGLDGDFYVLHVP
jgi:hypothetical protein